MGLMLDKTKLSSFYQFFVKKQNKYDIKQLSLHSTIQSKDMLKVKY